MSAASPAPFTAPGFVVSGGGPVRHVQARSRRRVERELVEASNARERATRALDFDAYQHLTEQIDDLLEELRALPAQRRAVD